MSLVRFVELPDVAARLAPFRKAPPRSEELIKVPAIGNRELAGTAFDYLLRFDLKRRAPHAKDRSWVANRASFCLSMEMLDPEGQVIPDPSFPADLNRFEAAGKASAVCRAAEKAYKDFIKDSRSDPSPESLREMATWAIRLGKLDSFYRGNEPDFTFERAEPELVDELLSLLAEVAFRHLIHSDTMLLNPDFGEASRLVDGADADLLTGDTLVDIKTTMSSALWSNHLDQLFGYFLLARRAGLPAINKVALYFARHGVFKVRETKKWTDMSEFEDTEKWFFEKAKEVYGVPCLKRPRRTSV